MLTGEERCLIRRDGKRVMAPLLAMSDDEVLGAANNLWQAERKTEARLLYRYLHARRQTLGCKLEPDGAA